MRQRQCIVLRFCDDLTVDAIASVLGMRPGTVKSHLNRALTSLGNSIPKGVRFWPDDLGHNTGADAVALGFASEEWTTASILGRELLSILAIAALSAFTLWLLPKRPQAAVVVLPLVIWFSSVTYNFLIADFGFVFDYDPFIGDLALGATFAELTFVPIPMTRVGSFAVGVASLSVTGLIWLWGGPTSPASEEPE